jgi:hypothetical protein
MADRIFEQVDNHLFKSAWRPLKQQQLLGHLHGDFIGRKAFFTLTTASDTISSTARAVCAAFLSRG